MRRKKVRATPIPDRSISRSYASWILRARKFPPENRAENISWYISVKNDANARLEGGEFIGKKYCIRAAGRWKSRERKRRGARVSEGRHEEVVLYLLWYDHRPLRIVNVGDCGHHLWDIGWEGYASEEIPRWMERRRCCEETMVGDGGRWGEWRALGGRSSQRARKCPRKLRRTGRNYASQDCNTSVKSRNVLTATSRLYSWYFTLKL